MHDMLYHTPQIHRLIWSLLFWSSGFPWPLSDEQYDSTSTSSFPVWMWLLFVWFNSSPVPCAVIWAPIDSLFKVHKYTTGWTGFGAQSFRGFSVFSGEEHTDKKHIDQVLIWHSKFAFAVVSWLQKSVNSLVKSSDRHFYCVSLIHSSIHSLSE